METRMYSMSDPHTFKTGIEMAAAFIRQGEVVAFPTETVYGLGADALSGQAVKRIFKAKGRPGDNPLIVHIDAIDELLTLTACVPHVAYRLIEAFWPGPLTIIFKKSARVPDIVTAGLSTVAVRMPDHAVARALIRESGVPIAAPSANRSGRPSPTTAYHVYEDMEGRIPLVLDDGAANVGLESTVLDLTDRSPLILRPGGVTLRMLREILPDVDIDPSILLPVEEGQRVKSPGMKYLHYAPNAPMIIFRGPLDKLPGYIQHRACIYLAQGKTVGILATEETKQAYRDGVVLSLGSRHTPAGLAFNLFARLRAFDTYKVDIILAEAVDASDEGLAVMNRMARAAGFHIVDIERDG